MTAEEAGVFFFDDPPAEAEPARTFAARAEGRTLCLVGDLDLASVVEAHARLAAGGFDAVDLSALRTCDGAGLQLLMWVTWAADLAGTPLRLTGAAGPVRAHLALAGLA